MPHKSFVPFCEPGRLVIYSLNIFMNCDSTRNSVQGLQSVILLINDTSLFSSEEPTENFGGELLSSDKYANFTEYKGNKTSHHFAIKVSYDKNSYYQ